MFSEDPEVGICKEMRL